MSMRARIQLPLLLAAALLASLLLWRGGASPAWPALAALGFVAAAIAAVEIHQQRTARSLQRLSAQLAAGDPAIADSPPAADPYQRLETGAADLRRRVQAAEEQLARSAEQRQKLETRVREIEERYALSIERANDGIWEWDLKSGRVQFSPRWQGMLGHVDAGMSRIEEWRELLHAEDRDAILLRLDNHIEGLTPHFEAEYRLRHQDGRYRWVQSRGAVFRHANGKPYRMLVMDIDVHGRKELEQTLIQAAEGLSAVSDMEFFQALMRNLSSILGTRDNLVCYCPDDPPTRARTLAYYSRGKFRDNIEYELEGTSCGAVIARGEIVYVPTGVCDLWPLERQYDRDSYLGVPLFDSGGRIIGHFACMDGKPMRQDLPHLAIFKIFAVRAAAELERTLLKRKLENVRLQSRVG